MSESKASFDKPQSLLANILLSLLVLTLLLGVVEIAGRFLEGQRPIRRVAQYIWDWQRMWDGDFYTVSSRAAGWPPTQEFNGMGLRDRTHSQEKPERAWRMAFLGDSVTMGDKIEAHEAYPQTLAARLEAHGRRIEVFNVALWGWSTRQERIAYERLARPFRPDLVVVGVCLNDIPELQNNLGRPPAWISFLFQHSAFVRWLTNAQGREIANVEELFHAPDSRGARQGFERFFSEIRLLRDSVLSDGAMFAMLVFPFRFQVETGAPPPLVQRRIVGFCQDESIPCLDLLPALRRIGPSAFIDYDHLSATGSRHVADEIERSGWLPAGYSYHEDFRRLETGLARTVTTKDLSTALLTSPDPALREAAAWALGRVADHSEEVVRVLTAALSSDSSRGVRARAARSLGEQSNAARSAKSMLFMALNDESEHVRHEASRALWRIAPDPMPDVPRLVEALENEDQDVRGFAAWKLGEIGPDARDAVPALMAMIERGRDSGEIATRALEHIGSQAVRAVPTLISSLRDEDLHTRANAARALGRIGSREAVEELVIALSDDQGLVRSEAARALGRIGVTAEPAVPALARLLSDTDEQVRAMAARALGFIPGATAAVPELNAALHDDSPRVAREVRKALSRIHASQ
ncbi:MAG: HEAT repeat domain-containing protein [Vicinamibacteria bacterium]|nr:HEAT repeat domain-containing protein [Vicinamibacteria bacterium]